MRTTPLRNRWLRFAVLRHSGYTGKSNHYDIVLELLPGQDSEEPALAKFETPTMLSARELKLEYRGNVRRRYLRYEGPMSENRGRVRRVDSGVYRFTGSDQLEFRGGRLSGHYYLDTGSPCESLTTIKKAGLLLKGAV